MSSNFKYEISFIIVCWNSKKFLTNCFNSIIKICTEQNLNYEIIALDNGSTDGSKNVYKIFSKKNWERFHIEYLGKNTGTTYSRNVGLKMASGEVICILDSDTELRTGNLNELINCLKKNNDVGMIVPTLFLSDDSIQDSVKKFPTFSNKLVKIAKAVFNIPVPNYDYYSEFPFQGVVEVDTAISACWFFCRDLINCIGLLDENIFYSPEDLDYCVRIRKHRLKILYWPKITVFHATQQISHRQPFSKTSLSHFFGLIYYFRKHGGWFSTKHLYR